MPIVVACRCGQRFAADDQLAGTEAACPVCGARLVIPRPKTAGGAAPRARTAPPAATPRSIPVQCQCGGRFAAEAPLFGKQVACPSCGRPLRIPTPPSTPAAAPGSPGLADLAPAPDPFADLLPASGLSAVGDPLAGYGQPSPLGAPPAAGLARPAARRGGGMGDKTGLGVQIVAFGICLVAAAAGLSVICEAITEVTLLIGMVSEPSAESLRRPTDHNQAREQLKALQARAERFATAGKVAQIFFRLSVIVGAVGTTVCAIGYLFCLTAPGGSGTMALALAATVMAITAVVLQVMFKVLPAFEQFARKVPYDHMTFGLGLAIVADTGDKILALVIDLAVASHLVLFPLFLLSVLQRRKTGDLGSQLMLSLWLMVGFLGAIVAVYLWGLVVGRDLSMRWPVYVGWVLHWGLNVVLGIGMVTYIKTLFEARQACA